MTEYEAGLPVAVAFPPQTVTSLAEIFAELGWRQFHVAETEKYAHVTYFFNGGVEAAVPGRGPAACAEPQGRDLRPAAGDERRWRDRRAWSAISRGTLRLHRRQLRQPGHGRPHRRLGRRGRRAVEFLDGCLGRVAEPRCRLDGRCCASPPTTAMPTRCATPSGNPMTAHSLNPVPFVLVGEAVRGRELRDGVLADVAPTLLELVGRAAGGGDDRQSLLERLTHASAAILAGRGEHPSRSARSSSASR